MCNCICNLRMRQNGLLHVAIGQNWTFELRILWINHPIQVSRQAFPRKIGQKMRGVCETHGYDNATYATAMSNLHAALHILHIWNLGLVKNAKPCQSTIMTEINWFNFSLWLICKFRKSSWLCYKVENTNLDRIL